MNTVNLTYTFKDRYYGRDEMENELLSLIDFKYELDAVVKKVDSKIRGLSVVVTGHAN